MGLVVFVIIQLIDMLFNIEIICRTDMGAVGILQVRNEFRKKGFGSLLVKAFSKLAVQSYNVDITAHIVVSNEASKILFKQLGFVKIELNSWVGFKG